MRRHYQHSSRFLVFSIFIGLSLLFLPDKISYAANATQSAIQTEASSSGISSKLDDLKKEIASKAANLKMDVDKKTQNKAFFGKITSMSTDTITVVSLQTDLSVTSTSSSLSKTIKLSEYTLYQNKTSQKSKKVLTAEGLQSGDTIVGLGDIDEKGLMNAKKIIKVDPITEKKRTFQLGQIVEMVDKNLLLHQSGRIDTKFPILASAFILNGKEEGSFLDLKQGRKAIISVGEKDEIEFVYLYPMTTLTKKLQEASGSGR